MTLERISWTGIPVETCRKLYRVLKNGRVVGCGRLMAAAPPLTDLLILCINGAFEVILPSSPLQPSTVLDHVLRTSGHS